MGTAAVTHGHEQVGAWETAYGGGGARVLELSTHSYSSSIEPNADYHFIGTWNRNENTAYYKYMVGLTGKISTGAARLQPRTFIYNGATLTVDVTREAASAISTLPVGCLTKLQMSLMDTDGEYTNFETIHIGQFRQLKYSGTSYTINMLDALEATGTRITDNEMLFAAPAVGRSGWYAWFATLGKRPETLFLELKATVVASSIIATLKAGYSNAVGMRFAQTYKDKWYSYPSGDTDYQLGSATVDGIAEHNQWALIKNTSGNIGGLYYTAMVSATVDGLARGRLTGVDVTSTRELPGINNITETTGGYGADSEVNTVCVLNGTPVTEIVNTLYCRGYAPDMVAGLFGGRIAPLTTTWSDSAVDWDDIDTYRDLFETVYVQQTSVLAPDKTCFVHVVQKEVTNGYQYIRKLVGKWGVFPRFKENAYTVGMVLPDVYENGAGKVNQNHFAAERTVIREDDIQSLQWNMRDDQVKGLYVDWSPVSTDNDDGASGFDAHLGVVTEWRKGDSLVIPSLEVNTTEVAAGWDAHGEDYSHFFKNVVFPEWYASARMACTLRLRGFRFAHLAPGDYVHVNIPKGHSPDMAPGYGPYDESGKSMIDTMRLETTHGGVVASAYGSFIEDLHDSQLVPWFVTSVQVDWTGALVTVSLSKPFRETQRWAQQWNDDSWGITAVSTNQDMSDAMGQPVHDITETSIPEDADE
tara:strand:+ start:509 stop:2605 length:2097 start_codon:yes stop_codon:yes gene_type:complete